MCFSTFDSIYVFLIGTILVRTLLNNSNFAPLVIVSLTSLLFFVFFYNFWAFFPLVSYFLKDYFLDFFTWLQTIFFNLKNYFSFGKEGEENETVMAMKKKRKLFLGKKKLAILLILNINPIILKTALLQ